MLTVTRAELLATIESLESILRVYRRSDYAGAARRVGEQLDAAYLQLDEIEREMGAKMGLASLS